MLIKARKTNKSKCLLMLPAMLLVSITFFGQTIKKEISRNLDRSVEMMKLGEDEIIWTPIKYTVYDSVVYIDKETGKEVTRHLKGHHDPLPITLNGKKIECMIFSNYMGSSERVKNTNTYKPFELYGEKLNSELKQLIMNKPEAGGYIGLNDVVINSDGEIIYYDIVYGSDDILNPMSGKAKEIYFKIISDLINENPKIEMDKAEQGTPVFVDRLCTLRF